MRRASTRQDEQAALRCRRSRHGRNARLLLHRVRRELRRFRRLRNLDGRGCRRDSLLWRSGVDRQPGKPYDLGLRALIGSAHQQTHLHIPCGPQVGNTTGAKILLRQFVVNRERPVLDLDGTALALLNDTGAVVPIDPQLTTHIDSVQGHLGRGVRSRVPEQYACQCCRDDCGDPRPAPSMIARNHERRSSRRRQGCFRLWRVRLSSWHRRDGLGRRRRLERTSRGLHCRRLDVELMPRCGRKHRSIGFAMEETCANGVESVRAQD